MTYIVRQNFTAGEVTPRMSARFDMAKYHNSCRVLFNAYALPHGPAMRRSGLRFVAEVKDSSSPVRLIPFEFSEEQAYILEFGSLYVRYYMDGGQIVDGGDAYETTTTYTADDIFNLNYAQSADILYLTHSNYAPASLSRTGHTSWALSDITFTDPPDSWAVDDHPSCVSFYEQRLCFASSPSAPQTIWTSKAGDYYDFGISSPLEDGDACTYTISSDQVNVIKWLSPSSVLAVGTTGGEWIMSGNGDVVTPTNISVVRQSTHGSKSVQPLTVGSVNLFVQRPDKVVREFRYSLESDSFESIDISILAEHFTRTNKIVDWAYQQAPNSIIWCVLEDGTLGALTYLRQHEVVGWHRHATDGDFESVAVIPGETEDEVWFVVKRTIDGETKRYIEYFAPEYTPESSDPSEAFFLDSALTYEGASTFTITGLDHLEGKEVHILGNGSVQPPQTVVDGAITLQNAVTYAHVGLQYVTDIEPMPLDLASDDSTTMGREKTVVKAHVSILESLGMEIGLSFDDLQSVIFRMSTDNMDDYLPLFTGIKSLVMPSDYNKEASVCIRQSLPLPLVVRGVTYELEVKN